MPYSRMLCGAAMSAALAAVSVTFPAGSRRPAIVLASALAALAAAALLIDIYAY